MQPQPQLAASAAELKEFGADPQQRPLMRELYRRAEAQLRQQRQKQHRPKAGAVKSEEDSERLLQELQVHQIELELQNAELQRARDELELTAEKYTDLYDFAPVGYLSLDEQGQILEVNLSGASLIGVGRSELIKRRLTAWVAPASRAIFLAFLKRVFTGNGKQVCEVMLRRTDGTTFWADFHGSPAIAAIKSGKWCRLVVTDITVLKRAEEAQRRSDAIVAANEELRQEIQQRKVIEESLKQSELHQRQLLEQSRQMQSRLRDLSRQVLHAQEEERKRISRELHDVIAQTLTGINIQLAALAKGAAINPRNLARSITRTQQLVGKSVEVVHEFARELRPAVLDDLGLIPALLAFVKSFSQRTRLHVQLKAFAGVEELDIAKRTVLFRVAQEALTNVARHARASRAEVTILKLADRIGLKIKDDGKSFQVEDVMDGKGSKRLGLLGMRERVEMVGGTFSVESAPGQGTTIHAEIPFTKVREVPPKKFRQQTHS